MHAKAQQQRPAGIPGGVYLDRNEIRSIRINTEFTNQHEVPQDLDWKEEGNIDRKRTRYASKPKGRMLFQRHADNKGAIRNVSMANLVRSIANAGFHPVKAYAEAKPGEGSTDSKSKFRVTHVYMSPQKYLHRPEIIEILPKMKDLRDRSKRQLSNLRTRVIWGYVYAYLNDVYDDVGGELVPSGEFQVDITAVYRTPLLKPDGSPNMVNGETVSPLWSLEVADRVLDIFSMREETEAEQQQAVDDALWFVDVDAFSL